MSSPTARFFVASFAHLYASAETVRGMRDQCQWLSVRTLLGTMRDLNTELEKYNSGIVWDHGRNQPFNIQHQPDSLGRLCTTTSVAFFTPENPADAAAVTSAINRTSIFSLHFNQGYATVTLPTSVRLMHETPGRSTASLTDRAVPAPPVAAK